MCGINARAFEIYVSRRVFIISPTSPPPPPTRLPVDDEPPPRTTARRFVRMRHGNRFIRNPHPPPSVARYRINQCDFRRKTSFSARVHALPLCVCAYAYDIIDNVRKWEIFFYNFLRALCGLLRRRRRFLGSFFHRDAFFFLSGIRSDRNDFPL